MAPTRIVTLLTDFGQRDAYVGIMKGVMLGIAPDLRMIDLTHDIPPQGILPGALLLRHAVGYFPAGTIHLAVIDPGVGGGRAPVVVTTDQGVLVGPNNGLLQPAAEAMGIRAVHRLADEFLFRRPVSNTFHGRDVFAPVAAHLAAGVAPENCGPALSALQPLVLPEPSTGAGAIRGEVVYVDHFGNMVTNIPEAAVVSFPTHTVSVSIAGLCIAGIVAAYAVVPEGAPLAVIGSWGLLEVAVRNGSAAARLGAGVGTPVTVCVE